MTIILKNKNHSIVAQFPKDSFERFYIGRDSMGTATITIVHTDGTVTILDERSNDIDVYSIAESLATQVKENNVVDEFSRLKDKVSLKFEEVKANTQLIAAVAGIYKDAFVSKLFSSKQKPESVKPKKEAVPSGNKESVPENVDLGEAGLDELFNRLEKAIISIVEPEKKASPSEQEVIKQINELYVKNELTYTRLYKLIGLVRENVKQKRSTNPEITLDEIVTILFMNKLL